MTDRTTDQVNYILDTNCHRESTQINQRSILNSIREIHDFLPTLDTQNYRVTSILSFEKQLEIRINLDWNHKLVIFIYENRSNV